MFGRRQPFRPCEVGQEINVKIEAVGEKGDGVAKVKGFVLFVPNTKEGDEVRIKVTRVLNKVGFADVVGPASGPITEDKAPSESQAEPEPAAEEPIPEDSEDFGEESAEEESAEEVSEEMETCENCGGEAGPDHECEQG